MRFARTITTIDAHAAGEPLRIVTAGVPPLPGETILDRRRAMLRDHDALRRVLLWEPRGHADMYGAILTPPVTPAADFGVLFMTNEGYSTMCGHGIVALTTALIETGWFPAVEPETTIGYDTPAGLVRARAAIVGDRVTDVTFRNVPAFRLARAVTIQTPLGETTVDLVFGGAFYALVDAAAFGLTLERVNTPELIRAGMAVKRAVEATIEVRHPEEPELTGLYGTILSGPPALPGSHGRNITIFAEAEVDRSPCGTGTSAKLAALYADGRVSLDQPYVHESIIDTTFTGRVVGETTVGDFPAVETEISGRGFITGFHQFVVDPDDPVGGVFLVR
jgi:proline racemase